MYKTHIIQQRITFSKLFSKVDLSPTAKLTLRALIDHINSKTGKCYPSQTLLAEENGLSRGKINKAIRELTEKNLILFSKKSGFSNSYILTDLFFSLIFPASEEENKLCQNDTTGCVKLTHPLYQSDTQTVHEQINKTEKKYFKNYYFQQEAEKAEKVEKIRAEESKKLLEKIHQEKKSSRGPKDFSYDEAFEYLRTVPDILEHTEVTRFLRDKYKIRKQLQIDLIKQA